MYSEDQLLWNQYRPTDCPDGLHGSDLYHVLQNQSPQAISRISIRIDKNNTIKVKELSHSYQYDSVIYILKAVVLSL